MVNKKQKKMLLESREMMDNPREKALKFIKVLWAMAIDISWIKLMLALNSSWMIK